MKKGRPRKSIKRDRKVTVSFLQTEMDCILKVANGKKYLSVFLRKLILKQVEKKLKNIEIL